MIDEEIFGRSDDEEKCAPKITIELKNDEYENLRDP